MALIFAEDRDFEMLGKKRNIMIAWLKSMKEAAGVITAEGQILLPNLLACAALLFKDSDVPRIAKMVALRNVVDEFLDVLPEYYQRWVSAGARKKVRINKILRLVQAQANSSRHNIEELIKRLAPSVITVEKQTYEEDQSQQHQSLSLSDDYDHFEQLDRIQIQDAIESEIRKAASIPERTKVEAVSSSNLRDNCTFEEAKTVVELITGGVSLLTACSMVGVKQSAAMAQIIYSKSLTDAYRDAIYIQTRATTDVLAINLANAVSNLLQERQVIYREMSRVPTQYFDQNGKQKVKMVVVKDKVVQKTIPPTESTIRNAMAIYESLLKKQAEYESYRISQLRKTLENKSDDELRQIAEAN